MGAASRRYEPDSSASGCLQSYRECRGNSGRGLLRQSVAVGLLQLEGAARLDLEHTGVRLEFVRVQCCLSVASRAVIRDERREDPLFAFAVGSEGVGPGPERGSRVWLDTGGPPDE